MSDETKATGSDIRKLSAMLEASGQNTLGQLLKWAAHFGIPAAFAVIMLLQTNTKLDKLIECVVKLTVVVEQKK